ncbi:MAG: polyprenol monophosphomannose synthase [Patescibacteria group bacterium]
MIKVSIIVPTYNESKNLPLLVQEIFDVIDKNKIDLEFIIVDDNSPDGTGQVAEELGKQYPVRAIHRAGKLGLGSAVIEGFKLSDRELMGVMDGDLSHDPAILNELILSLEDNDIAIGSRFVEGSTVEQWAMNRKLISEAGVFFARLLTGARDPLSGYFFIRKSVISGIDLRTKGYKILLEILVKGSFNRVKELPYKFRIRKFSSSKLNYEEYILFFKQILQYGWIKFKNFF